MIEGIIMRGFIVPAPFFAAYCPVVWLSCAVASPTPVGGENGRRHPRHLPLQDQGGRNGRVELRQS